MIRSLGSLQLRDVASDFVANEGRHELMKVLVKHFSFTPTDTSDQKAPCFNTSL